MGMSDLTYPDIKQLIQVCENEQARLFIILASHCWLKPTSLLLLSYDDVLVHDGILRPDNKTVLKLPVSVLSAVEVLKSKRRADRLIFQSQDYIEDKPLSSAFIRKKVKKAANASELDPQLASTIKLESFRKLWGRSVVLNSSENEQFESLRSLLPLIHAKDLTALARYLGVNYHGKKGRLSMDKRKLPLATM